MYQQPDIGSPPPRRLVRSSREHMWAGVAGGLAEYFDVDATLVRIIWVAVAIASGGLAIPAYLLLWVIMPREDRQEAAGQSRHRSRWSEQASPDEPQPVVDPAAAGEPATPSAASRKGEPSIFSTPLPPRPPAWESGHPFIPGEHHERRQRSTGLILVVLGVLFLAGNMGLFRWIDWHLMWPLVLVVVGVGLLAGQGRHWRS